MLSRLADHRSAVLGGLLSWCLAHIVTLAAFAHIHPGFVIHYHDWAGPLTVAVLALTITSVVTVGAATLRPSDRGSRVSPLTGAIAPAAFVVVEFAEYLAGIHEAPPAALLVIGCLVHAVIGTVAPGWWSDFLARPRLSPMALLPGAERERLGGVRGRDRSFPGIDVRAAWAGRAPPLPHGAN